MDRQHEQRLIHAALAGDRAAAGGLVRAHQDALYAFMLRRCGRPEIAEDVVQEAFVRALTNLHRFDMRFRFSTWLFTIAKRLHANAAQKCAPCFDSDLVGRVPAASGGAAGRAIRDEERHQARSELDRALATLTPMQRDILVLFHQCDWPIARIAEHLLMPTGTVKSHLHRGRRKMRVALQQIRQERTAGNGVACDGPADQCAQTSHGPSAGAAACGPARLERGVDR